MRDSRLVRTEVPERALRSWIATACEPAVVRRSLRVALVVGTLLVAINYGDRALATWAQRIRADGVPGTTWVYFNNDGGAAAVRNATRLLELTAEQPGNRRVA